MEDEQGGEGEERERERGEDGEVDYRLVAYDPSHRDSHSLEVKILTMSQTLANTAFIL